MNLITKDAAIAALRFNADEFKPETPQFLGAIFTNIAKRYSFLKLPDINTLDTGGRKFQHGKNPTTGAEIKELQLFSDAVGVTATDTHEAEALVHDVIKFMQSEMGFRTITTTPVLMLQSDVIVEFDNDPTKAFARFAPLIDFLRSQSGNANYDVGRWDFGAETKEDQPPRQFIIERRAGAAWALKRFFCKANMHSDQHLQALELVDRLLAG